MEATDYKLYAQAEQQQLNWLLAWVVAITAASLGWLWLSYGSFLTDVPLVVISWIVMGKSVDVIKLQSRGLPKDVSVYDVAITWFIMLSMAFATIWMMILCL